MQGKVAGLMALALILIGAACDSFPAGRHVGVYAKGPHGITIVFVRCRNFDARRIQLLEVRGDDPATDLPLWDIRAKTNAARVTEFPVGRVPKGFVESLPLSKPLPTHQLLATVQPTGAYPIGIVFRPRDLRRDRVFAENEFKTFNEFKRDALDNCRPKKV